MKIKKVVPRSEEPTAESEDGSSPEEGGDELLLPSVIAPPPDQVVAAGTETLTWLHRNRALVIGGLAALTLLIIFVSVRYQTNNERRADQAQPVLQALGTATMPPESVREGLTAREQGIRDAVAPLAGDSRLGAAATLLAARADLALGNAADARRGYDTLASNSTLSGLSIVARVGAADAAAASGDLDAALALVDGLGTELGEAWALRRRAELLDAFGTPERALEAWRAALAAATPQDAPSFEGRIARLEIDLAIEPSASED